ncbi:MAG: nitronate monooxygenase [Alphaproteobacteria bacterium]|nr:nitronate monooxygenase [Alphaproteobacteria bacterium]
MPLETELTQLLDIEHPILLAPMDLVAGGALAAAVSDAGGLGLIGAGYGQAEWMEREFAAAGNQRTGVGFITWSLGDRLELLDMALARKPQALMLSFGDPAPFAGRIKDAGVPLICQVQTVPDARAAVAAGADVIVAQGTEGGGHAQSRSTFTLVPAVVDAVAPVPVVAAGGVADGRGLAAALMLGAAGVLVGTRFYATQEALGQAEAKARIVAASGEDTVRGKLFDIIRDAKWPEEFTGRVLKNAFSDRWDGRDGELVAAIDDERTRFQEAAAQQDFDMLPVIAGEAAGLIHDLPPAGELVRRMVEDAKAALAAGRAGVG